MMRVALSTDHLKVQIEERELPVPGPGEMRVQIRKCGACTSDVLSWYVKKKAPVVLGHEPVATVDMPGEGVEGFQKGDRVFVHHHAPCGSCRFCQRKKYVLCPTWREQALLPGGFSEMAIVRPQAVRNDTLKLDPDIEDDAAALIEPFACSLHAFKQAGIRPGDRVTLIGMGGMGFLNACAARAYGVEEIAVTDLMPERLKLAEMFELPYIFDGRKEEVRDQLTRAFDGEGADVVIVGPGYLPAMELGLAACAPGGSVVLFTPGPPNETLAVNPFDFYFNDITLTTSYSCDPEDTRDALDFIRQGKLPHEKLITHRFPLERTEEALRLLAEGGDVLKVMIDVS